MRAYQPEVAAAAAAHGLDSDLVAAVVDRESGGWASAYRYEPDFFDRYLKNNPAYAHRNPREVSASYGLMQIMYPTAVDAGFTGQPWELFAPSVGLEWGCRVLASLLQWSRSLYTGLSSEAASVVTRSALAAYNGGKGKNAPTGVLRNRAYADEVLMRYAQIKRTVVP